MLTTQFYSQLAHLIKNGPRQWGTLSIAIGSGENSWDVTPPLLRRDITALNTEIMRKPIDLNDIQFLDSAGETSLEPTALLRVATTFSASEGSGTLRECGLWLEARDTAILLAYFIHPRIEKIPESRLQRNIQLDLNPGRALAQEIRTRYLGNAKTEELHDLENETGSCQLAEIRRDRRFYFNTIDEALTLGYDHCAFCFSRELSQR